MRRSRRGFLVGLAAAVCAAQTASDYETADVNKIAAKLQCDCGCKLNMACIMPPTGVCGVCRENKIRIASLLKQGLSEREILAQYTKERGNAVLVNRPGVLGFTGPYIALALGLGAVALAIRRYRHLRPAPVTAPANDQELRRYHDQIEKDLANLE
jgi:cytochrome c-type biogenesis protein CcmH/NrfF